ncbi:MAG: helix-turn-helix domain-containing protein [Oscillospiraceae bacterium]|nr:helix-turn-helix domain-containing protein [Oscillospiraceae bacterium]MCL2279374.1 helix-turn-helix domain-containing protein [Oscillospiraceae bacterium]
MLSIGEIIRTNRVKQKISQEELCFGICSLSSISRIENGAQAPSRVTYEALMERLGQAPEIFPSFKSDKELKAFRLKHQINQALRSGNLDNAEKLVNELESMHKLERVYRQLILHARVLLAMHRGEPPDEILEAMKNVAAMSIEDFSSDKILSHVLSKDDLVILENLASAHHDAGEKDTAIEILYAVKKYIEMKVVDDEGVTPMYTALLHPLTNWIGMKGQHEEVISLCDEGIKRCIEYGAYRSFAALLFNKGYALVMLDKKDEAKKYLQEAYFINRARGEENLCEICLDFAEENGIKLL